MEEKLKQMGSARWQQGLLNQWSGKVPGQKFEQSPNSRQGASNTGIQGRTLQAEETASVAV